MLLGAVISVWGRFCTAGGKSRMGGAATAPYAARNTASRSGLSYAELSGVADRAAQRPMSGAAEPHGDDSSARGSAAGLCAVWGVQCAVLPLHSCGTEIQRINPIQSDFSQSMISCKSSHCAHPTCNLAALRDGFCRTRKVALFGGRLGSRCQALYRPIVPRARCAVRGVQCAALPWLLRGRPVLALTEGTAAIESPTGAVTAYRLNNKPALGPACWAARNAGVIAWKLARTCANTA
jgi:hypothetical protein